MNKIIRRFCISLTLSFAGMLVFADAVPEGGAATTTWQGPDGGHWSEPSNWSQGVPGVDSRAEFPWREAPYAVEIDGTAVCRQITMFSATADQPCCTISFVGTGTLVSSEQKGSPFAFRQPVVVDGPTIDLSAGDEVVYNYDLTLVSGVLKVYGAEPNVPGATMPRAGVPPQLYVKGGSFSVAYQLQLHVSSGSTFHQTGGEAFIEDVYGRQPCTFDLRGGTFRYPRAFVFRAEAPLACDYRDLTLIAPEVNFWANLPMADNPITLYAREIVVSNRFLEANQGPYVNCPHGLVFRAAGDWTNQRIAYLNVRERFTVDTRDFNDGLTKHAVSMFQMLSFGPRETLELVGGGSVTAVDDLMNLAGRQMDAFLIKDGTALDMHSTGTSARSRHVFTENLELGDDTKLVLRAGQDSVNVTGASRIGANVKLVANYDASTPLTSGKGYTLLSAGPTGSVDAVTVELAGSWPAGWSVVKKNGVIYAADAAGEPVPDPTQTAEWSGVSGATDGLSVVENWSSGTVPTFDKNTKVRLNTARGTLTLDVDDLNLFCFIQSAQTRPLRIRGKTVTLSGYGNSNSSSAIQSSGYFPLVFENKVVQAAASALTDVFISDQTRPKSVAFLGGVDVHAVLGACGHVVLGGESTVGSLWLHMNRCRTAEFEVLNGARVTVTNQLDKTGTCVLDRGFFRVDEGGELVFGPAGVFRPLANLTHDVHGAMTIGCPYRPTADQSFFGRGVLRIADPSPESGSSVLSIGEKLTLLPACWPTAVAAAPDNVHRIRIETHATLGATSDWTYGVAAGCTPTTAAADRALTVAPHETLTVDTQNPDTGAAQTITFADPISAPAAELEKKGSGTLVLASDANDLATAAVTVSRGSLLVGANQAFGSLEVAAGASLLVDADGTEVFTVAVAGDVSVEGATVGLSKSAENVSGDFWTPVLTVPEGNAIVGTPIAAEGQKLKAIVNADGSTSLCCRKTRGFVIILR